MRKEEAAAIVKGRKSIVPSLAKVFVNFFIFAIMAMMLMGLLAMASCTLRCLQS